MDDDSQHEDDEELPETSNARNQTSNQRKQGEMDNEEEFLATFSEMQNFQRFDDTDVGSSFGSSNESASRSIDAGNGNDQGEIDDDDDDTDTVRGCRANESDDEWGTKAAAEIEKDLEEIQAEHRKITADDYIPTDEESVAEANNVSSSDVLWPFDADRPRRLVQAGKKRNKGKGRADLRMGENPHDDGSDDSAAENVSTRKRSRTNSEQSFSSIASSQLVSMPSLQSRITSHFQSPSSQKTGRLSKAALSFINDSASVDDSSSVEFSATLDNSSAADNSSYDDNDSFIDDSNLEGSFIDDSLSSLDGSSNVDNALLTDTRVAPMEAVSAAESPAAKRKPGRPKKNSAASQRQVEQVRRLDTYFSKLYVSRSYCRPSTSKSTSNANEASSTSKTSSNAENSSESEANSNTGKAKSSNT
ncbi:hypothetical protein G6F42_012207 [Rhizopus arrhizus]|nr:hypothetical protein G6F42_012207 [Rhizopus arrhizus]